MENQDNKNLKPTVIEKLVSIYLERVKEIIDWNNAENEVGVEPKISEFFFGDMRLENEEYDDYKDRLKAEKLILKHYLKGVRYLPNN